MCYPHIVNFLGGQAPSAHAAAYHLLPLHDSRADLAPPPPTPSCFGNVWNGVRGACAWLCVPRGPYSGSDADTPTSNDGAHRRLVCRKHRTCSFDGPGARLLEMKTLVGRSASRTSISDCSFSLHNSSDLFCDEYYFYPEAKDADDFTAPEEPGPLVPNGSRFVLCSHLSEGSTSHVMLARVLFPGACEEQDVAVKVISKARAVSALRDRGRVEPSGHSPFLTPLLAAFQDKNNVYLVMTLHHRLRHLAAEGRKLGVPEIRLYAAELLCALKAIHETHRTVHSDLKFKNILISPSGHLCLADFGLAKQFPEDVAPKMSTFFWCRTPQVRAAPDVDRPVEDPDAADLIDRVRRWFILMLASISTMISDRQSSPPVAAHDFADPGPQIFLHDVRCTLAYPDFDSGDSVQRSAHRVEGRQYSPLYRPHGPPPALDGPSVDFSTCLFSEGELERLSANTRPAFASLDVDYMCPSEILIDPLH
ncbi:kinase-like domain-containing protein [Mycena maculata]|uniref:Kinase-like domain-containing protein n=1 Tax=Mycena maculata TaxID=230809 RepID=A0AAD7NC03_9AGAR|nr:kinase-like domain-containing protein [Mycena maculata]